MARLWPRRTNMGNTRNRLSKLAAMSGIFLCAFGSAQAQVRKVCPGGVSMRLSAGSAAQGGLLEAMVTKPKELTGITSEWDGRAIPLWNEGQSERELHGLIGVDLEKAP